MEMLAKKDKGKSVIHTEPVKSDYCLCLAIHAPRKGIIEVTTLPSLNNIIFVLIVFLIDYALN